MSFELLRNPTNAGVPPPHPRGIFAKMKTGGPCPLFRLCADAMDRDVRLS